MPLPPKDSNLPLYRGARWHAMGQTVAPAKGHNAGLVWERFFDGYERRFDGYERRFDGYERRFDRFLEITEQVDRRSKEITRQEQHGKGDFIFGFHGLSIEPVHGLAERQQVLVYCLGGKVQVYKLDWHFVTGMGQEHPTENGFAWHRTLGTPYLPGSSVKGLIRGWIEWNGVDHEYHDRLKDWFGTENKKSVAEQAGWYIFFDALPTGPVKLAADVMTPHMGDWYEKGDTIRARHGEPDPSVVPADWHSPNPVTFLVVREATFQFGVAIRENLPLEQRNQAAKELDQVLTVLQEALEWGGAGAKTAAGYGRMLPDERANRALEKQSEESLPPEERLRKLVESWSEQELAERFGPNINATRNDHGQHFDLLVRFVLEFREPEIESWKNHTKKTNKPRWKAYRNLMNPGGGEANE